MPSRDYKAEYARRISEAAKRGLSRSQARGHSRSGEAALKPPKIAKPDPKLEAALKELRKTGNQGASAKVAGVSTERFRRFLRDQKLAERKSRRWIITDSRPRSLEIIAEGRRHHIVVAGFEAASIVGKHNAAIRHFLETNDASLLAPFKGATIEDIPGHSYILETRPNVLYRLMDEGAGSYENIYRIVA